VSDVPGFSPSFSLLTLREIRGYIRRSHAVMMTVAFVLLYALGSMTLGQMLILTHVPGGYTTVLFWGNGLGQSPWNYPALLVVAPWGIVSLPFFATLSMVVVSIGVGMGMSVAVLLAIALVRHRRSAGRAASIGSAAGLTPAMIALVTLGACCSTTAAATAGVGLVAQVSGTSTTNLLLNNWFLGVFQMVVVWVALVAQELVLRVYGGLFGQGSTGSEAPYVAPRLSLRFLAGGLARVALLVGGVTWSLTTLVEWTSVAPLGASAALWFHWTVQQQVPALLAVVAALFPTSLARIGGRILRSPLRALPIAGLTVAGASLVVGAPPPIAGWGVEGFANEVASVGGLSAAMGAVTPVFPFGLDLLFRWGLQYLLLGGFALAVAWAPERTFRLLDWSVGRTGVTDIRPPTPLPAVRPSFSVGRVGGGTGSVEASASGEP
jgi:hypothetical protein